MDVRLRGENGRDICKKIKDDEKTNHVRVILISASPDLLANYSECEADAAIEKPFDMDILYETIKRIVSPPLQQAS